MIRIPRCSEAEEVTGMKTGNPIRQSGKRTFNIIAVSILGFMSLLAIIPFIMIVTGSFSSSDEIIKHGYSFLIQKFSTDAYKMVFLDPQEMGNSYMVSIVVTLSGTILGLIIMSMAGYAIQCREMRFRNSIAFYFYFTTLFSGGLVPWYMLISNMGMRDTLWSLMVPALLNSFYILLIRNFMKEIPDSLAESAKIDGAGQFRIYVQIILPLSKPILATVALFVALGYWNNWYLASLFITNVRLWPLQFRLHRVLTAAQAVAQGGAEHFQNAIIPTETVKLATAVVTTLPILVVYPFLQKYFVAGITIGAVKG